MATRTRPTVALVPTASPAGYWLINGGDAFSFGDASSVRTSGGPAVRLAADASG